DHAEVPFAPSQKDVANFVREINLDAGVRIQDDLRAVRQRGPEALPDLRFVAHWHGPKGAAIPGALDPVKKRGMKVQDEQKHRGRDGGDGDALPRDGA